MWLKKLPYNPIEILIDSNNPAITYFSQRDLLGEKVPDIKYLWELPVPQRIIRRQEDEGCWIYPGGNTKIRSPENYNQVETFRQLGELVEKYGFNKNHPSVQVAANYLFTFQTDEGNFRGVYGNQYAPTYTSVIMEILIKAGFHKDPRIKKGFDWLISQRQEDGGWAIPLRTKQISYRDALKLKDAVKGDPSKPFSHLITGMVLRAFGAHPQYRKSEIARHAGKLLMSRFFQRDKYPDRQDKKYWESVSFPFWFTDIVTSLDSLYSFGFGVEEPQIKLALDWLVSKQSKEGIFDLKLLRTKDKDLRLWITLAICRILKRYYSE